MDQVPSCRHLILKLPPEMKYKMEENILERKNIALKRKTSLPDGRFIDFA